MAEADRVDAEEDALFGEDNPGEVAEEWCDRRTRAERIRVALARTEQAAAQAAQAEEAKVAARRARVEDSTERLAEQRDAAAARREDYQPRLAAAEAAAAQAVSDHVANLTDPDSGWMPTGKGWIQGYNTELAVSDDQIVLAVKVTNATVDCAQFEPMMAAAIAGAEIMDRGRVRAGAESELVQLLLADAGYLSEHNLTLPRPNRLIATTKRQRLEAVARHGQVAGRKSELIKQMSIRLATEAGIQAYRRGVTVEPVNGHLKDRHGLRQFSCRGLKAAQAEAELAAATANLKKIWRSRS